MASYAIAGAGASISLTDSASARVRRAAVLGVATLVISCVPVVHNTRHMIATGSSLEINDASAITYLGPQRKAIITSPSLGLSATALVSGAKRLATTASSCQLTFVGDAALVPDMGYAIGSVSSLEINDASAIGYVEAGNRVAILDLNQSFGLSQAGTINKILNRQGTGSLGLSNISRPGASRRISSSSSLGITSRPDFGSSRGTFSFSSLGMTGSVLSSVTRALRNPASLGLRASARLGIVPVIPADLGGIVLMEAAGTPAIFSQIIPRNSKSLLRDITRSIESKSYQLLN